MLHTPLLFPSLAKFAPRTTARSKKDSCYFCVLDTQGLDSNPLFLRIFGRAMSSEASKPVRCGKMLNSATTRIIQDVSGSYQHRMLVRFRNKFGMTRNRRTHFVTPYRESFLIPLINITSGIIATQAIAHTSKVSLKAPMFAC